MSDEEDLVETELLEPISERSQSHQTTTSDSLAKDATVNRLSDSAGKVQPSLGKQHKSCRVLQVNSKQEARSPVKLTNIYSTLLAGFQSLTVRRAQSETSESMQQWLTKKPDAEIEPKEVKLDEMSVIRELSELQVIKRLSCFEEICPSDQDACSNGFDNDDKDGFYELGLSNLTEELKLDLKPSSFMEQAYRSQPDKEGCKVEKA